MDITDWLCANVERLDTIEPEAAELDVLRDIVGDARVVAIGESTHRVHEFYQLRHAGYLADPATSTRCCAPASPATWDGARKCATNCSGSTNTTAAPSQGPLLRHGHARFQRVGPTRCTGRPVLPRRRRPGLRRRHPAAPPTPFDYLPTDRTGLAWAAPALHAYLALDSAHRNELAPRIAELAERLQALCVPYSATDPVRADVALQRAITARRADAFLANMAAAAERTYRAPTRATWPWPTTSDGSSKGRIASSSARPMGICNAGRTGCHRSSTRTRSSSASTSIERSLRTWW